METTQTSKTQGIIIACGLIIGAVFGVAGSSVEPGITQNVLWEISSLGFITGCALMSLKIFKMGWSIVPAGFIMLAIAEGVMSSGTANGNVASFGAGLAIYVPALWLACIPKGFPIWIRIIGGLASVPFAIAAAKIFLGQQVPATSVYPSAGYTLLSIAFLAWSWWAVKKQD